MSAMETKSASSMTRRSTTQTTQYSSDSREAKLDRQDVYSATDVWTVEDDNQFKRFEGFMANIVAVPKEEIDAAREVERNRARADLAKFEPLVAKRLAKVSEPHPTEEDNQDTTSTNEALASGDQASIKERHERE